MPGLREVAHEDDRRPVADAKRYRPETSQGSGGINGSLMTTIQTEVIPRLMLAHGLVVGEGTSRSTSRVEESDVEAFTKCALMDGDAAVAAQIAKLEDRGVRTEDLFLDLLAPSARLLGEYWSSDRCSFVEVTVAVARMQRTMHDLASRLEFEIDHLQQSCSAMFLPAPGENHTFGVTMVAEFFRRAGWSVTEDLARDEQEILVAVEARPVSLIGFSLSGEVLIDRLASVIASIRSLTLGRSVSIMVGGPVFVDHPDWVERVGADAMALDGREGVVQAQRLVRSAEVSF